ncbi:MAG TPA: PIG-L deacetylase family protein [Dehalococcoidia bacterium]|nr:PIG-L deacetylase family protein [Dehalococcoidia bacterium]
MMAGRPQGIQVDVVAFFAHPDDVDFLCGGTIAKLAAEGKRIWYVLATSGDKGTSDRAIPPHELAVRREIEQRNAAMALGALGVSYLGYPDGFLEDTAEFRGKLVRQLRLLRPDVVITFDPYRRSHNHRDHRTIGQATLDAAFPLARDHLAYPEHLTEEGLEPHRVAEVWLAGPDDPDYYVDIGDHFHQRLRAIACHKSQVGDAGMSDEFEERMRQRSREVGEAAGYEFAEAFRRIQFRR